MQLTELIHRALDGDTGAAEALFAETYPVLRRLAHARLRSVGRDGVLDTGALVHESYLRFAEAGRLHLNDRVHFLRWAGHVMRSVIVDAARRRLARRRGGGAPHVALTTRVGGTTASAADDILRVHEALKTLAEAAPRLAQVVEMRYFGGLSEAEIAEALGVTERTIRRDWDKARLLLREALS